MSSVDWTVCCIFLGSLEDAKTRKDQPGRHLDVRAGGVVFVEDGDGGMIAVNPNVVYEVFEDEV